MNARRFLIAVAATGATSLTAPLIASAGTVRIDASAGANVLRYVADAGEYNELFIALQSGRFTIQDGTSGTRDTLFVAAEAPCERDTTPQPSTGLIDAYCPPAGVEAIAVGLGDGDDSASIGGDFPATLDGGEQADRLWGGSQADDLRGGPGNDTLTGNGGRDRLSGGDGDDTIEAADGLPDEVSCGWGYDTVKADAADSVADDCELNTRQEQPATPPQAVQPPRAVQAPQPIGPPQRTGMRVEQAPTLGGVQRRGLRAEVSCTAACIAQTQLLLPTLARPNTRRRRLLGSGRVKLEAAGRASLVTHLRPGAARRIRRVGHARLTLRTIVRLDAETTVVIQRRVTLR